LQASQKQAGPHQAWQPAYVLQPGYVPGMQQGMRS
jgi:hypothetical protein